MEAEEARRRQQLSRQTSAAAPSGGPSAQPSPANTSSSAAAAVQAAAAPAKVIISEATLDPSLGIFLPATPLNRPKKFFSMQSSMGDEAPPGVPFDLDMYITACMGNVYQSSGDDEQALVQYSKGWDISKNYDEADWAAVFLNSIGLVCYYNLRYELGYQCFTSVAAYRAKVTFASLK